MKSKTAKPLFLSASRIDTFLSCSQKYAARYLLKLPDAGNDGSRRGSTCHDVLELLQKPRHFKRFRDAITHDNCREVPALWRLIRRFAKKYGVDDPTNLALIDEFIMVGLKHGFRGPKGTKKLEVEREFTIEVNRGGRRYNVRGFIDRVSHVSDEKGLWLECADYKSSVGKMEAPDDTIQSQVYQLALRHLYPEIKRRTFHYLFLRFPKVPVQEVTPMSDDQLDGLEWYLTTIQETMEKFTLANQGDNLMAFNGDQGNIRKHCGREGVKKDGSPAHICSARMPMDYWVIVDGDGELVEGAFTEQALAPKLKKGQKTDKRRYNGCAAYFNKEGKPRNFN